MMKQFTHKNTHYNVLSSQAFSEQFAKAILSCIFQYNEIHFSSLSSMYLYTFKLAENACISL